MPGIEITVNVADVKQRFNDLADRDIPFLTAFALTKTIQEAQASEVQQMKTVFDRPVDWTLNSMQVVPASKTDNPITAELKFKEFGGGTPAWKYLTPEIEGGIRRRKSHEVRLISVGVMKADEYAVPGEGVALDAYGNMPAADIEQLLSQLQAAGGSGFMANTTARSRKRAVRNAGGSFFVLRGTKAPNGVYMRTGGRDIVPFLIFVHAPTYTPRFAAYETARKAVNENFAKYFAQGFRQYVTW